MTTTLNLSNSQRLSPTNAPRVWRSRLKKINGLFVATVVIPTLLAIIYWGFIASDVYVSESRFTVQAPRPKQSSTGIGAILQSAGAGHGQEDSNDVESFILSRDALQQLSKQMPVQHAYADHHIDLFSRFAALDGDTSFEALYRYYLKRIEIDLDPVSGIPSLKVSAYSAEDAYQINEKLLRLAEEMVNKMSARARTETIGFAQATVDEAQDKVKKTGAALSAFRQKKSLFDPEHQSTAQLAIITKIEESIITTKSQLDQFTTFAPSNPQVPSLKKQLASLQAEMKLQMDKVAGLSASLTTESPEYERLTLEKEFAAKQLQGAVASLEEARIEAARKQLYLERIVEPITPDMAIEPRRSRNIIATLLLGLVAWGVLSMLLASVREHQD